MLTPCLANILNTLQSLSLDLEGSIQERVDVSSSFISGYVKSLYPSISTFFDANGAAKAFVHAAFTWPSPTGDGRWQLPPRIRAVFNLSRFFRDRLLADALLRASWFYLSSTVDAPSVWITSGEPIEDEYARLCYRAVIETEADWWWLSSATSYSSYDWKTCGLIPLTAAKAADGSCYLGVDDMWALVDRANDPTLWRR